jgi:hypothetical protein
LFDNSSYFAFRKSAVFLVTQTSLECTLLVVRHHDVQILIILIDSFHAYNVFMVKCLANLNLPMKKFHSPQVAGFGKLLDCEFLRRILVAHGSLDNTVFSGLDYAEELVVEANV